MVLTTHAPRDYGDAIDRIRELTKLQKGWYPDEPDSQPPTRAAADTALSLLLAAKRAAGAVPEGIGANLDGSLEMSWKGKVGVSIDRGGSYELTIVIHELQTRVTNHASDDRFEFASWVAWAYDAPPPSAH